MPMPFEERLMKDALVRRAAQIIIGASFLLLFTLLLLLLIVSILAGPLNIVAADGFLLRFYNVVDYLVVFPYDTALQSLLPTAMSLMPIALARVCYERDELDTSKPSDQLNFLGKSCLVFALSMFIFGALSTTLLSEYQTRMINYLDDEGFRSAQKLSTSIPTLMAAYFLQFIGMKPQ